MKNANKIFGKYCCSGKMLVAPLWFCDPKWPAFYLHGLNEKGFGGNDNSNIDEVEFGKIFPPLSGTGATEAHSRLQRNNHVSSCSLQDFFEKINDVLQNNLYNSFNMIFIIRNIAKRKILDDVFYLK